MINLEKIIFGTKFNIVIYKAFNLYIVSYGLPNQFQEEGLGSAEEVVDFLYDLSNGIEDKEEFLDFCKRIRKFQYVEGLELTTTMRELTALGKENEIDTVDLMKALGL